MRYRQRFAGRYFLSFGEIVFVSANDADGSVEPVFAKETGVVGGNRGATSADKQADSTTAADSHRRKEGESLPR